MNKEHLIAVGEAAFGGRWQTDIAELLGVNDRTVRRWVSGQSGIPELLAADLRVILKARKKLIEEALIMINEKFLMNPATGSVDTAENWLAEMPSWETLYNGRPADCWDEWELEHLDSFTPQQQFDSLIEVEKDESGDWVEV